jgi:lipoprotein-anchoring transpeptidase ErfK/SrfK
MAGMTWNDDANVCSAAPLAAEVLPNANGSKSQTTDASRQSFTRSDCDKAGMTWNDSANVCGEKSGTQAASKTTTPAPSSILINIDKTKQQMTVFLDGVESYNWPVSTGKSGYATPSGTFTATSMNEIWYSKEWDNAPMPHAIFFMKDGHAIHGSYDVKHLGKAASHGCVRISPENAATLYSLVAKTGLKIPRSYWQAMLPEPKWLVSPEAELAIVRTLAVRSSRGSTTMQSRFRSRNGAAGFSAASLGVHRTLCVLSFVG